MTRVLLLCLANAIVAAGQQSGAAAEGDASRGKALFSNAGCFECHGYAGQGGRAGARIVPMPMALEDVIRYVRRPAGEMPAYTDKVLSDGELKDIYAYLKSFAKPRAARDIPLLERIKERR